MSYGRESGDGIYWMVVWDLQDGRIDGIGFA
jgi:hypothetical protein